MTKPTPKRKPFRRECWAIVFDNGEYIIKPRRTDFLFPRTAVRVLITELPRKGRDGK